MDAECAVLQLLLTVCVCQLALSTYRKLVKLRWHVCVPLCCISTIHPAFSATWRSKATLHATAVFKIPSCSVSFFYFFLFPCPASFSVRIRSKSLSDIPMVYPVRKGPDGNIINDVGQDTGIASEWNQENKHQCRVAAKDSEAQWQDVSLASCLSRICSMNIYKSIITGQTSSADRSRTATERTLWGELTTLCLNMFMPVNPFLKFEILMSTTKTFLNKKMVL